MVVFEFEIDGFVAKFHGSAADIPTAEWDACGADVEPLVQQRHLLVLEECGLVSAHTGFLPRLLLLRDRDGRAVGAAPAYLKDHSAGEMGVDLGLPLAHTRGFGPYYPKLQIEVPMISTPGSRLLVRPGADERRVRRALLGALDRIAEEAGASSVQISYGTADDQAAAIAAGFAPSEGNIFVWRSRGEASFAEFVASMHKKGRARVRDDRATAASLGLQYERITGADLVPCAARAYDLYAETCQRHATVPYLNANYFTVAFAAMPDAFDLLVAKRESEWVALLIGVRGGRTFHVQHWGAGDVGRNLIFEMFYQELESAVAAGFRVVDFGATGQHKSLRGIGIEPTRHAVRFRNPQFQNIATAAGARRQAAAAAERAAEDAKLPFADKAARAGAWMTATEVSE